MDEKLLLLACFVLIAYTTQTMAGFGCNVIALTLGAHLYRLEALLPVLVPLTIVVNLYIVARNSRHIHRSILLRNILPLMAVGLAGGILTFHFIAGRALKLTYAVFIICISAYELFILRKGVKASKPLPAVVSRPSILLAGVIQGLYASGGPLLVYVVSRLGLSKSVFRSTLAALWLILNIVLLVSYAVTGKMTVEALKDTGLLLPAVVLGMIAGEKLHRLVDERLFRYVVYSILLVAGGAIILR